jgi:hypothetical protein
LSAGTREKSDDKKAKPFWKINTVVVALEKKVGSIHLNLIRIINFEQCSYC